MAAKKAVNLSTLSFADLRDKAKELEGYKAMNRFELTQAARQAENLPVCPEAEKANPRQIKPEISAAKAKLSEGGDKAARKALRQSVKRLKRQTRKYL